MQLDVPVLMMRWLAALCLLLLVAAAAAYAMPRGGPVIACPSPSQVNPGFGNSTPDGSVIVSQSGSNTSCLFTDKLGVTYQFLGSVIYINGGSAGTYTGQAQLTMGLGFAMLSGTCVPNNSNLVYKYRASGGALTPAVNFTTLPSPLPFKLTHNSVTTSYPTYGGAAFGVATGDSIEILATQGTLPIWYGASRSGNGASNVTLTLDDGAGLGCSFDLSAVVDFDTSNGSMNGWTIQGVNTNPTHQVIGAQNGVVCLFAPGGQTSTVQIQNLVVKNITLRDCLFGMEYNTQATGTGELNNVLLDHNGLNCSGAGNSPCHNAYWGFLTVGNYSVANIHGAGSYCLAPDPIVGSFFKTRWVAGTIHNYTMAEVDPFFGFSDPSQCAANWATSADCGGHWTWGGTATGDGIVVELANGWANSTGFDFFRVDRDGGGGSQSTDCPIVNGYWANSDCQAAVSANCAVLLQHAIVINDATPGTGQFKGEAYLFTIEANFPHSVTYTNNKIVMNTITPAPTGAIASNGAITGLSTNVNTLGWTVGMPICDPSQMTSNPGLGLIPYGVTISTIASNGLSAQLSASITGATGQTDTFYAGSCVYASNTAGGNPPATDGGSNTWYPNRTAASLAAYPALPSPP